MTSRIVYMKRYINALQAEISILKGRINGYQQELLDKKAREGAAKYETCSLCGQLWPDGAIPTHKPGCKGWQDFLKVIQRRAKKPLVFKGILGLGMDGVRG